MTTTYNTTIASTAHSETISCEPRLGLFRRFVNSMMEARARAAEREIERYIIAHGGTLTDSIERDLSRTFGGPSGSNH